MLSFFTRWRRPTFLFCFSVIFLSALSFPLVCESTFTGFFQNAPPSAMLGDRSVVGNFQGKFSVNLSGSATYDIPIMVPQGTAGMSPTLSIHYDSSSGNGLLGMGFSLEGLTAITRAPQNYAQNGKVHGVDFTNEDHFALNGQQLVAMPGQTYGADSAEYRTYIDSQTRIISLGKQGNGPASFVVQTKGGQTAWYGTTSDSQILAQGTNTVAIWALAKIQDAAGNYLTYHYTKEEANGCYVISEIDYTSNDAAKLQSYNKVIFQYENRPDAITTYTAGFLFKTTKRLSAIQTYQGTPENPTANHVFTYQLNYETSPNTFRSRITSIQQCDVQGACLRPIQFTWQTNAMGWEEAPQWKPPAPFVHYNISPGRPASDTGVRMVDLDETGRPEFIENFGNGNYRDPYQERQRAWKATDQGWQVDPDFTMPFYFSTMYYSNSVYESAIQEGVDYVDLTAEGHPHFIQAWDDLSRPKNGGGKVSNEEIYQAHHWIYDHHHWVEEGMPEFHHVVINLTQLGIYANLATVQSAVFADIQGKGRPSLLFGGIEGRNLPASTWSYDAKTGWQQEPNYVLPLSFIHGAYELGSSTGMQVLDLNKDGLADILVANDEQRQIWLNTGSGWEKSVSYLVPDSFRLVINDMNRTKDGGGRLIQLTQSGLPDLVMAKNGEHQAWLNTGASFITASDLTPPSDAIHDDRDIGLVISDITGSGLSAWLQCSDAIDGGKCHTWLNENGKWVEHSEYALPAKVMDRGEENGVRLVDLLGTGFPDVLIHNGGQVDAWLNKAQKKPDQIIQIQDALGDHTQIQYKPITDNRVYTKGDTAKYPNQDIQVPIWVVSQTSSDTSVTPQNLLNTQIKTQAITQKMRSLADSTHTQHITDYHYAKGEINHLGLGFLGFGEMTATDESTGISTTTLVSQDAESHTQGLPLGTITQTKERTVLNEQHTSLATQTFGTGKLNETYYFPYAKSTEEKSYDLNGDWLSTKTTENVLDAYGNPLDVKETAKDTTGTYITETKNQVVNTIDLWHLGQIQHSEIMTSATSENTTNVSRINRYTDFTYDDQGFLKTTTDMNGIQKTFHRDAFGNIIQTEVKSTSKEIPAVADRSEKVTYDAFGQFITSQTNALNQTTSQEVDPKWGAITKITDANGLITRNVLDSYGRIIQTIHPDQTITQIESQWTGGGVDSVAPANAVYKIIQTQTNSPTKITYYDELDRVIAQTTQGFIGDQPNHSSAGRWIWQFTYYDEIGRVIGKTLPFFAGDSIYETTNQYDLLGRIILTTNPDGSEVKQRYGGYRTATINSKNQTTTRIQNVRGNLVESIDPEGHHTHYTYDSFNHLIQLVDSKGHSTSIGYGNNGNKLWVDDPDRGKTTYTYDSLGELMSQTDANHNATRLQYDLLGRMIARTDQDKNGNATTSTWEYDTALHGIGKLAKENGVSGMLRSSPNAVERLHASQDHLIDYQKTYGYDSLSRLINTTTTIQHQNYTTQQSYNDQGLPRTMTYPNHLRVTTHYDALGYVTRLTDEDTGDTYQHINQEDAQGHILSETQANGMITTRSYDPKTNFLTDIQTTGSIIPQKSADVQFLHYDYDVLGNPTTKEDRLLKLEDHYQYDDLNRLTQDQTRDSSHNSTANLTYQYDELGNITNKSDVGHYTYGENNAGPHAVTSIHSLNNTSGAIDTFVYDANGNQTEAIKNTAQGKIIRNIAYTSFDVPKQITQSNDQMQSDATVNFYYDANRKRFMREDQSTITNPSTHQATVNKITTLYLDGMEIESSTDNSGAIHTKTKNYIGDAEKVSDGNDSSHNHVYSILKDNIGSTSIITDETGNIIQRFYYDPFGEQDLVMDRDMSHSKTAVTRYGFTGQEEVEAGGINLIHMNGRMYDPHLGRFLSADPIIQEPSNSQSLNRYSYCLNDPLAYTDPSGFSWWHHITHSIGHLFHDVGHESMNALRTPMIGSLLEIAVGAVAITTLPVGATALVTFEHFATAAMFSGVVSYAQTESVGRGLQTAGFTLATEYLWLGVGTALGGDAGEQANPFRATMVHGAVGGGINLIQGNSFKDGFLAAAVSQAFSGPISNIQGLGSQWSDLMGRGLAAGVIGGTAAATNGGNFENGMMTSAFAQMFNDDGPENGAKLVEEAASDLTDIAEGVAVDAVSTALIPETFGASAVGDVAGTAKIAKGITALAAGAEESAGTVQQTAQRIAEHAYDKHVIKGEEFPGINSQEEFAAHIEHVMNNATEVKVLMSGRTGYWYQPSQTVVVRNPNVSYGGSAYRPPDAKFYFDNILK